MIVIAPYDSLAVKSVQYSGYRTRNLAISKVAPWLAMLWTDLPDDNCDPGPFHLQSNVVRWQHRSGQIGASVHPTGKVGGGSSVLGRCCSLELDIYSGQ